MDRDYDYTVRSSFTGVTTWQLGHRPLIVLYMIKHPIKFLYLTSKTQINAYRYLYATMSTVHEPALG